MSRFYNQAGIAQLEIPTADNKKLRSVTILDAKKHGWVASVTTICGLLSEGDFLTNWKIQQYLNAAVGLGPILTTDFKKWKKMVEETARKEMDKAPRLGTDVHNLIQQYHLHRVGDRLDTLVDDNSKLSPYLQSLHNFCEEHNVVAQDKDSIEKTVVVQAARTAGTIDFIGKFGGHKNVILDWKTQKVRGEPYFYYKFPLQLAAYWHALGKKAKICSVIIDTSEHDKYDLSRGYLPSFHYKFYDNPLEYFEEFQFLSRIYYKLNNWPEQRGE